MKTIRMEDIMMNIDFLKKYVTNGIWETEDLRAYKTDLLLMAQQGQKKFKPLKKEMYSGNKIQIIDFFSGAGGTSLGFSAVNDIIPIFDFLGGCDINKFSAESYAHNFDTPVINRDIIELAEDKEELIKVLNTIGYDKRKPTILIGCAPCQGFTSHRKKYWKEEDDHRNNLVNVFADIVGFIQPIAFVMENVPEFLSNRYWKYFYTAKNRYEQDRKSVV